MRFISESIEIAAINKMAQSVNQWEPITALKRLAFDFTHQGEIS